MERTIHAKHIRIAPRKARVIVRLVQGKTAGDALEMLRFVNRAGARPVAKIIETAVEEVKRKDPTLNIDDLIIKAGWVDQAAAMKRRRPRARGYATMIKKYFSHLNLVLSDGRD
jgi:large subunit ribosomal protein L22